MKKLLALVLAMACALSLGIPTLAKTADYTWNQVNVEDFVDEDGDKIADDDVIRPGQTIYWVFGKYSDYDYLLDDKMVKIDVDKDEGSKNIDGKPKVVGKKLGNLGRCVALEIVIKDTYTADELKTKLDIYITAKKDLIADNAGTIVNGNYEFPQFKPGTPGSTGGDVTALKKAVEDAQKKVNDLNAEKTRLEKEIADLEKAPAMAEWTKERTTASGATYKYSTIDEDIQNALNAKNNAQTAKDQADQAVTNAQTDKGKKETEYNKLSAEETVNGSYLYVKKYEEQLNTALKNINDTLTAAAVTGYTGADGNNYKVTTTVTKDNVGNMDSWAVEKVGAAGDYTTVSDDTVTLKAAINGAVQNEVASATEAVAALNGITETAAELKTKMDQLKSDLDKLNGAAAVDGSILNLQQKADEAQTNLTAATTKHTELSAVKGTTEYTTTQTNAGTETTKLQKAREDLAKITNDDVNDSNTLKYAEKVLADAKTALQNGAGSVGGLGYLKKGETMKVPMTIWIQNENRVDDDATFVAGEKGVVIKPVKNEENTVTWEDNNDTLAIMKFTADSDVEYYMPRMATKWNNEDYLDYFDDMDAYIRSFVGNPSIPCTSRARLWINNPFVDDDGEETIDPDDIYVYEVVDGELYDITDKVEYTTNDDDDYAFLIKTRTLGTYIFSDGPADIEDEDDDDYDPEAPDKVEVNNNKKPVPPTGF